MSDHDIRAALAALPETSPDEALWPRVARAREARLRHRRTATTLGTLAGVAIVVGLMHEAVIKPDHGNFADAGGVAAADAPRADAHAIEHIDRELQLAYARGADATELEGLWTLRRELTRAHGAARPIRI